MPAGENDLTPNEKETDASCFDQTYFIGRRVEVRIHHRRVHFPSFWVSSLSEHCPFLGLVTHPSGDVSKSLD